MKVKIELDIDIMAKAILRSDKIELSVTGAMPLTPGQERTTSATVNDGFSDKVYKLFQKAFDALIEEQQEIVIQRARVGAGEALAVAARMGEL